MLYTTNDLTRFFNQGEQNIANEQPFLVDRLSIPVTVGTNTYALPDYVLSIRRITWMGIKLDPLPRRSQRDVFQAATQVGTPFWYVYNNIGANLIQLFPSPPVNLPFVTNVWDTDIPRGLIVEFYRMTDNSTFVIPPIWRNVLLKRYTAHMINLVDGQGQNLKLAKYFKDQWALWKGLFFSDLQELHYKPRKYIIGDNAYKPYFPASPMLPIARFGIGVDEGY